MRNEQFIEENLKINPYIKAKFKIIQDMVLVNIVIRMVQFMLENLKMVKEMDTVSIEKEQQEIVTGESIKMVIGMAKEI